MENRSVLGAQGWSTISVPEDSTIADVVIYGATPSGIMAAVAAVRAGSSHVILIEPTGWIGGMVSGGISHTDIAETLNKCLVVGLADEYFKRIAEDHYRITQNGFWVNSYNGEPSVNLMYLEKYIAEHKITLYTNSPLVQLQKSGTEIVLATFENVGAVQAQVYIDATYEGDLMRAAGCSYVIGRESNATYGETYNGVRGLAVGQVQFTGTIDPYVVPGNSASGLLPGITGTELAASGSADNNVQAFCLRLTVTSNGSNKIPFPSTAPANYNALRYELLGRELASGRSLTTMTDFFAITGLRGSSKYDANNWFCVGLDYCSPSCREWLTASWSRRAEIAKEIKDYTLGLLYWLKTDARVPSGFKASLNNYGFCKDEYGDYEGVTPQVYVREGPRMIGDFVMTQTHMSLSNGFTDEVALGYYMVDSHACQVLYTGGTVRVEGPDAGMAVPAGYKVPYRVMLPKVSECTNLLVTFCGSFSRVPFLSLRMEPVMMALGQAAGIAAAISSARGVTVQNVPTSEIKLKQDIYKTNDRRAIVLDVTNPTTNGTITETGTWVDSTALFAYIGTKSRACSVAGGTIKFAPNITESGTYDIYVKSSVGSSVDATRTANATVTLSGAEGSYSKTWSQKSSAISGDWDHIGTRDFRVGTPSTDYVLFDTTGSTGSTVVSAVKFVKRDPK
jgi:hypothetical protein